MRSLTLLAMLFSFASHADDLSPQDVAKIQNEQAKANAEIDKKYGNKKASELSADERRSIQKEKSAAEREVLEKHGTDPKSFAHANSKMGREDRAATDAAARDLDKKDKDAAAAPATDPKKGGKKEIVIDKNGKSGAPGDNDANEAADMDRAAGLGKGKSKK